MRYLRSLVFDLGLALVLIGVLAALWTAKDMLKFYWLRYSDAGGIGAESMSLSGFVLAFLLAMIGLAMLIVGAIRVRQGT